MPAQKQPKRMPSSKSKERKFAIGDGDYDSPSPTSKRRKVRKGSPAGEKRERGKSKRKGSEPRRERRKRNAEDVAVSPEAGRRTPDSRKSDARRKTSEARKKSAEPKRKGSDISAKPKRKGSENARRKGSDVNRKKSKHDAKQKNRDRGKSNGHKKMPKGGVQQKRREVYRSDVIEPRFWKGTKNILTMECESPIEDQCVLRVKTLCETPILDLKGKRLNHIPSGKEIEVRGFSIKTIGDKTECVAPVVQGATQGYICLNDGPKQQVELTKETLQNCHVRMYKNEKRLLRHKWLSTWPLRCVRYETEDSEDSKHAQFTLRYALRDEDDVKIFNTATRDIYLSWLYLFSSNRELTMQERKMRADDKFSTPEEIDAEFERVVLTRMAPSHRARYMRIDNLMKVDMIDTYRDMIASKTMKDYLDSLSKPNVSASDLALLRGALDDNDLDWAEVFVEDLGITLIISAVESKKDDSAIWEINKVALECFEAIMDKPPDDGKSGVDLVIGQKAAIEFIISQLNHPNEEVRQRVIFLIKIAWYSCLQKKSEKTEEIITDIKEILAQFAEEHEAESLWEVFIVEMANDPTNVHYASSILAVLNCFMESYDIDDRIEARGIIDQTPLNNIIASINIHISENKEAFLSEMSEILDSYDDELQKFNDSRGMDQRAVTYKNLDLSDPEQLFAHLYNVCIEDGNIDELRRCLHSLILIPREFSHMWSTASSALEKSARFVNDELDKFSNHPSVDENLKEQDHYQYIIHHIEARNAEHDPATKLRQAENNLEELGHLRKVQSQAEKDIKDRNERIDTLEEEVSDLMTAIEKIAEDRKMLKDQNSKLQKECSEVKARYDEMKDTLDKFKQETEVKSKKKLEDLKNRDRVLKRQQTDLELLKKELEEAKISLVRAKSVSPRMIQPSVQESTSDQEPSNLPQELMKYWRMLKMKIPKSAILHKMRQDSISEDRFAEVEASLKSFEKESENSAPATRIASRSVSFRIAPTTTEPAKKEDISIPADLKKYHIMLTKLKIPKQAVENRMRQDGIDVSRMCEIDGSGGKKKEEAVEIPEDLKKYHRMLTKMKIPKSAVENKMRMDGIDPARMCEIDGSGGKKKMEIPEELKKYHRMLTKMKIPASAVQNKMKMDGIDPARICEIDGSGGKQKVEIPEELKKYHRMLTKMKIPASAVQNKMKMDGIDPARISEIDGSGALPKKMRALTRTRSTVATKRLNENKKKFLNINMGKSVPGSRFWANFSTEDTKEAIEEKELLEWFGKEKKDEKSAGKRKKGKKRKMPEKETLVEDPKKSRALEIFMGVLKRKSLSLDMIKKSMWKLDELLIDEPLLESLMEVMPDGGEIDRARAFAGKEESLNPPSQFFWAMRLIPRPKQRAKLWLIKRRFHENVEKVTESLDVLHNAVYTIEKSPSLKNCFFCILTYLNAVSGSSNHSFRLRVLASVNSKKTRKQNTTFLQYFIRKLQDKGETNLDFIEELTCLNDAERRSCGIIKNGIDEMKAGMRQVSNSLKAYGKPVVEPDCVDNYKFVMSEFMKSGNDTINKVATRLEELETFIANLAQDLGETARDENGVIDLTFLKTLNKFRKDVRKALKANEAEDKKKKRRARIKKQEEEKKRRAEERKKKREATRSAKRKASSPSNHVQNNSPSITPTITVSVTDAESPQFGLPEPPRRGSAGSGLRAPPPQSKRNFSVANLDLEQITGRKPRAHTYSTGVKSDMNIPQKRHSIHHSRTSSLMPKSKEGFLNQIDNRLKTGTKRQAERIRKRTRGVSIRDSLLFAKKVNSVEFTPPASPRLSPHTPFGLSALSEDQKSDELPFSSSATVEVHYNSSATIEQHFPTATVEKHFSTAIVENHFPTATVEKHFPTATVEKHFPGSAKVERHYPKRRRSDQFNATRARGVSEVLKDDDEEEEPFTTPRKKSLRETVMGGAQTPD